MSTNPSMSPENVSMTDIPEFRYLAALYPEHREKAMQDLEWHRERLEFSISQLLPRVKKREFMDWLDAMWEEADEGYQDYLSSRHE